MAVTPWSARGTILTFSQNPDPFRAQENSGVQTSFLNVQTDAFVNITDISLFSVINSGGEADDAVSNATLVAQNRFN